MQIFAKKDPLASAEDALADLARREDGLRNRLASARADLEAATSDRRALLTTGEPDDSAIAEANARVDRAQSNLDGLTDALTAISQQRAVAESELAAVKDGLARATEAEGVDRVIAAARESAAVLDRSLEDFVSKFALFGAGEPVARLAAVSRQRFEGEAGEALRQLELYKGRLLSGEAALPPPAKPKLEVVAAPAAAPIATKAVFPIKNIKWKDENGDVQMCNKYRTIEIPLSLVARALAAGVVREPSDPTCKQLVLAHGGGMGWPDPASCVDLDSLPELAATSAA